MSRSTLDPTSSLLVSCTGLSPSLVCLPRQFHYHTGHITWSEPRNARIPVWALPISLAATFGIDVSFSSSGYLDVSVPRVPGVWLCIHHTSLEVHSSRFPHSEISGSKDICSSPKLFAAYHVFHRLLVPRHPPCALSSLTSSLSAAGTASIRRCIALHPWSRVYLILSVTYLSIRLGCLD